MAGRRIDHIGRCVFTVPGLIDTIIRERNLAGSFVENDPDVELFNQYTGNMICAYTPETESMSMEEYDSVHRKAWFTPKSYQEMDIEQFLLNKCRTESQKQRVFEELNIYKERDLYPVLKHLVFLIDHFRKNSVVWGVGRGSSVSSYVLYLIGVHKVDSIKYELSITDFLK